ncbi:MAG: hypothetical protein IPL61_38710 [Myxococcales bacterium]|nr:hypothetical protein [Myxococcales bacterium]
MSDSTLTDDDLDLRVRAASAALAALAAPGRVDGLAARVEAELADLDAHGTSARMPLETSMTSDTDDKPVPEKISPPSTRADDSGLHDIRALAQTTRQRISRRITSQHDVDEQMLSSSTSSLRAIALPEPAMIVALPDAPASMDEVRVAGVAASVGPGATVTPIGRKRTGLWVGLGGAAVAAAAAAVLLAGGGGTKSGDEERVATAAPSEAGAGSAAARSQTATVESAAAPTVAPPAPPPIEPSAGSAAPGAVADPAAPKNELGDRDQPRDDRSGRSASGAGGGSPPSAGASTGSGSAKAAPSSGSAKAPGGGSAKPGAGSGSAKPSGGGAGAGGKPGEKSIEDLLNDASGGATKPNDDATPKAPTGPTKTSLEPKEIKAGMSAVAGAAQSCFGKHGVAGHVKVKAVVASSGAVSKVDALGEFAGTPTGGCVAAAVKGASFPAWTGAPMSVTYSFTLQE